MTISIEWESETIIRHVFDGAWKWEDLYASVEEIISALNDQEHTVDIITDFSSSSMVPPGPTSQFKYVEGFLNHPKIGKIILVGANIIIETFMRIFMRFTRSRDRFLFAATLDEAHAKLADSRSPK